MVHNNYTNYVTVNQIGPFLFQVSRAVSYDLINLELHRKRLEFWPAFEESLKSLFFFQKKRCNFDKTNDVFLSDLF